MILNVTVNVAISPYYLLENCDLSLEEIVLFLLL